MAKNEPAKQHWVPVSYLRYFRDPATPIEEPLIWVSRKDKPLQKARLDKPRNIFFEKHLNTLELPDGQKYYGIESDYGEKIDSKYPRLIEKIEKREALTSDEHQTLCLFAAAQLMRTPQVRNSTVDFINRIAGMGDEIAKAHGKESKQAEKLRVHAKNIHTLNTVESIPKIANILYRMNVAFGCAPIAGKRFITSDNPVFMRNPDLQWQKFYGPGLMQERIEIYFPASPTTLVIFGWQNCRGFIRLNNHWVSEMNRWIQGHAMSWFVGPSKKTELYWFSKYPADPFFLLRIIRFRIGMLLNRIREKYAKI